MKYIGTIKELLEIIKFIFFLIGFCYVVGIILKYLGIIVDYKYKRLDGR